MCVCMLWLEAGEHCSGQCDEILITGVPLVLWGLERGKLYGQEMFFILLNQVKYSEK